MSVSAWGVDHGAEISKKWSDPDNRHARRQAGYATGGALVAGAGPLVAGGRAANKSRPGRKAANFGRSFGRTLGESTAGGLAGAAVGAGLTRRAGGAQVGAFLGGTGGTAHGAYAAGRNAQKRGDLKKR